MKRSVWPAAAAMVASLDCAFMIAALDADTAFRFVLKAALAAVVAAAGIFLFVGEWINSEGRK